MIYPTINLSVPFGTMQDRRVKIVLYTTVLLMDHSSKCIMFVNKITNACTGANVIMFYLCRRYELNVKHGCACVHFCISDKV